MARNEVEQVDGEIRLYERLAKRKPMPAKIEIACYANSYDIKDDLKGRGWKFSEGVPCIARGGALDFMNPAVAKGWSLVTEDFDIAGKELAWIVENGWNLVEHDRVTTTLRSVVEGRPDLVG